MPSPQLLLSEQAAFAKHLFTQGYPLWNPDPDLLPRARRSVGLRIGDVGTVDERGRFDFFFNILESLPGSDGSPPNFPPIEEDDIRCDGGDLLPREVVSSPETPWHVDQLDLSDVAGITRRTTQYDATLSDDGAHIILPQGAQLYELGLHHRQLFENYAREHGAEWLERFRDRLGPPRSNSIYLLTGFYKTCSWSIASFSMRTAANTDPVGVYCTLVEVDERTIREASVWQPAGRFKRKIGPPPDRQGPNNQTIFIRAITVTRNLCEQEPDEQREAGLLGTLVSLTRSLSSLAGDSNWATATETPKNDVIIQHVPQISQASHPSEIINQYLLTKEPSAKIAVTHDSQWIAMLKSLEGGQSWTLEDLENHLEALVPVHYSIATHSDTVYLRDKECESPTHSGVDRLHLPSGLESDITSDKKPHVHESFADFQRIIDPRVVSDELGVTGGPSSDLMELNPDWTTPSQSASQTLRSVRSRSSSSTGSPSSSHYTASSHSHRHSMKDSSTIITTNSAPLSNPGGSFLTRSDHLGELGDLEQGSASDLKQDFWTQGVQLLRRFERFSDFDDLQQAISLLEDFFLSASLSDPRYLVGLTKLGIALSYRFRHLGELSDLEDAISRQKDAVLLTPDGHPNKPGHLNDLGNDLRVRFHRLGQLGDLEEAISSHSDAVDLTRNGHPNEAVHLNNLGNDFRARFEHLGELRDLEQAISRHRDAVDLTPDGHPNKHGYLTNLGNDFRARFQCLGELRDLEQAISRHEHAIDLTSDGHPNKPGHLHDLGDHFRARFKRLGQLDDLEQAISRHRDAVNLTRDGHPNEAVHLNNLGNDLRARFECLGELSDLEHAISRHRDAVDLTPDGHPNKPVHLNNLGNDFKARFQRLGELSDLEQAISRHRDAVDLTPDGHHNKPGYLKNLGHDFKARFERLGELEDLEQATSSHKNAVNLIPKGSSMHTDAIAPTSASESHSHPDKPTSLLTVTPPNLVI